MDEDYERILLIKPDVFIYKIPPRTTNRAYRASDWKLDEPDWVGKLKVVAKGNECLIKLEDKNNGQLFAKCPVDKYPGTAIESVSDSSRYFVIRIQDENTNRTAFIGIGFSDRGDSFDLNVALQDHFKIVNKAETGEVAEADTQPKLDLQLKEGQTIKVNLNLKKSGNATSRPRTKVATGGGIGILPPPPGGIKLPPPSAAKQAAVNTVNNPPAVKNNTATEARTTTNAANDLLLDFDSFSISRSSEASSNNCPKSLASTDLLNDFDSAFNNTTATTKSSNDWANF
ncbi:adaptin ear-binding coat-associated protein 1-like protein [Leptotrombidium deliense]|uniref:Adaptin ear-binding coat-associated protein 1-like protein n=1 Tax=Leptotrombidium deliense TaxID=299467 RepID=A0A443S3S9_9ACAR|nr:adaptin ear-binding coat-associated protein 1-like protein [Leptotrombidium deliense]